MSPLGFENTPNTLNVLFNILIMSPIVVESFAVNKECICVPLQNSLNVTSLSVVLSPIS